MDHVCLCLCSISRMTQVGVGVKRSSLLFTSPVGGFNAVADQCLLCRGYSTASYCILEICLLLQLERMQM